MRCAALALAAVLGPAPAVAQVAPPRVLSVIAHPDDDAMFAGTVYKITHTLGGVADIAVITDGSGGFRYSHLAEPLYGRRLTEEAVARQYLPGIRKRELMAGGAITGVRNYFFLDELDHGYTENVDSVLGHVWDAARVRRRLTELLRRGYDFVFVHLPIQAFHGHHKAASILTLEAVQALPVESRPVVLGGFVGDKDPSALAGYRGLQGHAVTRVREDLEPFVFDRTQAIDPEGRLDYRVVVNWLIAEHKSQGTMQLLVNAGEVERYWYFAVNGSEGIIPTRSLFDQLAPRSGDR